MCNNQTCWSQSLFSAMFKSSWEMLCGGAALLPILLLHWSSPLPCPWVTCTASGVQSFGLFAWSQSTQSARCMSMSHVAQIQAPGGARQRKVDVMFKWESSEMVIRPQASQLPLGIEEIKHSHTHIWGNYLICFNTYISSSFARRRSMFCRYELIFVFVIFPWICCQRLRKGSIYSLYFSDIGFRYLCMFMNMCISS